MSDSPFQKQLEKEFPVGSEVNGWKIESAVLVFADGKHIGVAAVTFSRNGKMQSRNIVLANLGVGTLITTRDDKVILTEQTRFATKTTGWEIPQETMDMGESLEAGAIRAAREEAGVRTYKSVGPLFEMHPAPHRFTERTQYFWMRINAYHPSDNFDKTEIDRVKSFSRREIRGMIANRKITEAGTLLCLMWWLRNIN